MLVGALLGALLPVLLEAGILGLDLSQDVRQMCVGLLHRDALHLKW
jgi:ABC-type xylose transport system permease subunit